MNILEEAQNLTHAEKEFNRCILRNYVQSYDGENSAWFWLRVIEQERKERKK